MLVHLAIASTWNFFLAYNFAKKYFLSHAMNIYVRDVIGEDLSRYISIKMSLVCRVAIKH